MEHTVDLIDTAATRGEALGGVETREPGTVTGSTGASTCPTLARGSIRGRQGTLLRGGQS
jgi:hypothetical protein